MTLNEIGKNLIGKTCKVMNLGLKLIGTIVDVRETNYSYEIEISHEPVNWGGDIYTKKVHLIRKSDLWGIESISVIR